MHISTRFLVSGILVILLSLFFHTSVLLAGDTLRVRSHDRVDMTWHGPYDEEVELPDPDRSYKKVVLVATLGCATGGCSDWDYTVQLDFLKPNLPVDSSILRIDTLEGGVQDTIWEVTREDVWIHLGRLITPYGGYMRTGSNGYDNNWTRTFELDITDLLPLLEQQTTVRAFYDGWSSGFSITLDFLFIEGRPLRQVVGASQLFYWGQTYHTAAEFNDILTPPVTRLTPAGAETAAIRFVPTGHGFDNDVVCAEFCPRSYTWRVDGATAASGVIWKDDCGMNATFPQGGTWVYNRANWCPGEMVPVHHLGLDDVLRPGALQTYDLDLEAYTWSGPQAPSYYMAAQIIYYGPYQRRLDAAVEAVLAPNEEETYKRFNPICGQPRIRIRNEATDLIREVVIHYGVAGGSSCTYTWEGNLPAGLSADISLPLLPWQGVDPAGPRFFAEIVSVNGVTDEDPANDRREVGFVLPPVVRDQFVLEMRANSRPADFVYSLSTDQGDTLIHRRPATAFGAYRDTLQLAPGCYRFEIRDAGGLGLSDWPTGQGNGIVEFQRRLGSGFVPFITLPRDFGSYYQYEFTVGYSLEEEPDKPSCTGTSSIDRSGVNSSGITVFPNPASGQVHISSDRDIDEVHLLDLMGRTLSAVYPGGQRSATVLLPEGLPGGIYLLKVYGAGFRETVRVQTDR